MIEAIVQRNTVPDLQGRMQDWHKLVRGQLLKDVAQLTVRQAKDRVATTKHSPDLKPWPPRKTGGDWPLLNKTGRMLRSISKRRQGVGEYLSGVKAPYGKFHHTGTRRGLEPRPFIGVGQVDAREIDQLIETFVELRF